MTKFNAKNERTKRRYLHYLKNAKGNGDAVVDGAMQAIHRFEVYTRFRDFDKFDTRQAIAFKDHLAKQTNTRTKEHLSQATLRSILAALKAFFRWLASQPGYRRLTYSDADYEPARRSHCDGAAGKVAADHRANPARRGHDAE